MVKNRAIRKVSRNVSITGLYCNTDLKGVSNLCYYPTVMVNQTVQQILALEKRARAIVEQAEKDRLNLLAAAHQQAQDDLAAAEQNARSAAEQMLAAAQRTAEQAKKELLAENAGAIEQLRRQTAPKLEEAKRLCR
jgi:vacuolar-type H+-ATPase subunit H